jgi:hypothetical protein
LIVCCNCNPKIVWDKRFDGDSDNDCLVTVDGTDFKCFEPRPFNKKFFSHKINHSGLRYEIAISIKRGAIVWIHGPFPCGAWPDMRIFRDSLQHHLSDKERVEADDGYVGDAPKFVKCPKSFVNPAENRKMQSIVRSRHETCNSRFKMWGILNQVFRHDRMKHCDVFRTCAIMTQLSIENGEKLFQVEYDDILNCTVVFALLVNKN